MVPACARAPSDDTTQAMVMMRIANASRAKGSSQDTRNFRGEVMANSRMNRKCRAFIKQWPAFASMAGTTSVPVPLLYEQVSRHKCRVGRALDPGLPSHRTRQLIERY